MRYLPSAPTEHRFVLETGQTQAFSFSQLSQMAEAHAACLHRSGLVRGDRVCLYLPNSLELLAALFGNHLLGLVTVPLNPASTQEELEYIASQAEISALISEQSCARSLRCHLRPSELRQAWEVSSTGFPLNEDPDAAALLCFTSGTTARPKGVVLTHGNIRSNLNDLMQVWKWSGRDRLLLSLPLFHIHGLGVGLHGWAMSGCQAVIFQRFDPERVLKTLRDDAVTLFMAVPTMYRRMAEVWEKTPFAFPALRLAITGSAPMPVELHRKCRDMLGQTVLERYGMTETIMIASNPLHDRRPGAVGLPLPSLQMRLLDEHQREIEELQTAGEIWVRGPNVFKGYWRDAEASRQAFKEDWFRTGDLASRDEDGYYHILGRVAVDFIKSGGHRIGSRELEEVLERHPAVREAAVIGLPDPDLGERVAAFVVEDFPVEEEELREHCRRSLAGYKCPRDIFKLESLPRNAMGKVVKARLRDRGRSAGKPEGGG